MLTAKSYTLFPDEAGLIEAGWPAEQATQFAGVVEQVLSPLLWWVYLGVFIAAAWASIKKLTEVGRTMFGQRPAQTS